MKVSFNCDMILGKKVPNTKLMDGVKDEQGKDSVDAIQVKVPAGMPIDDSEYNLPTDEALGMAKIIKNVIGADNNKTVSAKG